MSASVAGYVLALWIGMFGIVPTDWRLVWYSLCMLARLGQGRSRLLAVHASCPQLDLSSVGSSP
jgi:hypothetical protein